MVMRFLVHQIAVRQVLVELKSLLSEKKNFWCPLLAAYFRFQLISIPKCQYQRLQIKESTLIY